MVNAPGVVVLVSRPASITRLTRRKASTTMARMLAGVTRMNPNVSRAGSALAAPDAPPTSNCSTANTATNGNTGRTVPTTWPAGRCASATITATTASTSRLVT